MDRFIITKREREKKEREPEKRRTNERKRKPGPKREKKILEEGNHENIDKKDSSKKYLKEIR